MNVLYITIDKSLTQDPKNSFQNSLDREIAIGKKMENYHIIAMSQTCCAPYKVSTNTVIYPIAAKGMLSFIYKSLCVGKKICKNKSIDLISTQDPLLTGFVGLRLKKLFTIPLNIQYHGDFLNNPYWLKEHWLNHVFNRLGMYVIAKADSFLLGVTPNLQKKITNVFRVSKERIFVLPYGLGIDRHHFNNRNGHLMRERFVQNPTDKIALYVGRLCKQKNLPLLLEAAREVLLESPETIFLIIGEGPEKKKLIKMAYQLKINKHLFFIGNIPYRQIPDYYAASDVVILPSLYEGCPRVLMEAMAAKKPIVTTDRGFANIGPQINQHYFVINKHDPRILAQAINHIFSENFSTRSPMYSLPECEHEFDQKFAIQGYIDAWQATLRAT